MRMKKHLFSFFLFFSCFTGFAQQCTGFLSPGGTVPPNNFTDRSYAFSSDEQWAMVANGDTCTCPRLFLSYDAGVNYTSVEYLGPFPTNDQSLVAGGPTYTWGRTWLPTEINPTDFRLKISSPLLNLSQGYIFNFNIPSDASSIDGIAVRLECHGDPNHVNMYLDHVEANVYYTSPAGIQPLSLTSTVRLFPNPAHDVLSIKLGEEKCEQLSLLDLRGNVVVNLFAVNSDHLDVPVSLLPRGIYFVRIVSSEKVLMQKIILD
jgi:hypothetical protein